MAKLDIIVPIYNVEKYLRKCLDSLVNQDYSDFFVRLINDGMESISRIQSLSLLSIQMII